MAVLAWRLRRAGYRTRTFGYAVTFESLERITERFVNRIGSELAGEPSPWAVVGHSLGCVVTRFAMPRLPAGARAFVMLAPPNHPPAIARALAGNWLFRAFTRDAGRKLVDSEFFAALPRPTMPALVIAGTRGPLASWLPFRGQPNDSIVRVEEARLEGVPLVEIPGAHTFLMNRADVFAKIREFFAQQGLVPPGNRMRRVDGALVE